MRGVSRLTAAAESVIDQMPADLPVSLPDDGDLVDASSGFVARPGELTVVAVTAAPAATGTAKTAASARLREVRRLITP